MMFIFFETKLSKVLQILRLLEILMALNNFFRNTSFFSRKETRIPRVAFGTTFLQQCCNQLPFRELKIVRESWVLM